MDSELKKTILVAAVFVWMVWGLGLLPATAHAENPEVMIGGSGSALQTIKFLAAAFEKTHPRVKIRVVPSLGSSGGIRAALHGVLDIAISARPLNEGEREGGVVISEYARTPFVFVVHKGINKSAVTIQELEKIYGGKMTNWPDGTRIRLVIRPEKETDTRIVAGLSPAMNQMVRYARSREGMIFAVTDQNNANALEKTRGAIGGCTLTQIISERRELKILTFNGIRPSVVALRTGSYRLFKPLYIITTAKTSLSARLFVEFVRSPEGQRILTENGNLAITIK
jgi:phosphate transport system substrate-binding protein